jgi:hypothetical protein
MPPDTVMSEQDLMEHLAEGNPLPEAGLTIGEDFYDDEPDPNDSTYKDTGDPISAAVGTAGFMERHMVQDCRIVTPDGASTEPEEFERYYFPPGDRPYDGPAPILIDILHSDDPGVQEEERAEKNVAFKTQWCAEQGIRYVVLHDTDDTLLSTQDLRAKLMGDQPAATTADPSESGEPGEPGLQENPIAVETIDMSDAKLEVDAPAPAPEAKAKPGRRRGRGKVQHPRKG